MEAESDAWYTDKGNEADVVLSTKVRIARNLANFPFPIKMKGRDAERYIEYIHCRSFRLRALEPVRISVDGEVLDFKESEFEILPGAIRLVLPQGSAFL